MLKKSAVALLLAAMIFLCSCSKESKFGLSEFTARMNESYGTSIENSSFLLGTKEDGSSYLFCETGNGLLTLFPDTNNTIKGASLLALSGESTESLITYFTKICCVLTGASDEEQSATLKNCGITADKIKFADSTTINTVGKYKYVSVCNEYAITLFCERV